MLEKIEFENNSPYKIEIRELDGEEMHSHDAVEMIYILKGSIYENVGTDYRKMTPGDGMIICSRDNHLLYSDEPCIIAKLYFNPQFFEVYKIQSTIDSIVNLHASKGVEYCHRLNNIMLRILLLAYKDTNESKRILSKLVSEDYQIIIFSISQYDCYKNSKIQITQPLLERYNRIMDFILANWNRPIQISEIAEKEHISETRLSHFWKDVTGTSFQNTIVTLKTLKARDLVVSSTLCIKDISKYCGFSDPKYFYKYFRELFDMSPKEYRHQYIDALQRSQQSHHTFKDRVLPKQEAEAYINKYVIPHYVVKNEFSPNIIPLQEIPKEKAISSLLEVIQKNQPVEIQNVTNTNPMLYTISLSENKAMYLEDNNYRINWEYIYIAIQYAIQCRFDVRIVIDYSIMEQALWLNVLTQFQEEINKIWGDVITLSCTILVRKLYSRDESEDLIERFKKVSPTFKQIEIMYVS